MAAQSLKLRSWPSDAAEHEHTANVQSRGRPFITMKVWIDDRVC